MADAAELNWRKDRFLRWLDEANIIAYVPVDRYSEIVETNPQSIYTNQNLGGLAKVLPGLHEPSSYVVGYFLATHPWLAEEIGTSKLMKVSIEGVVFTSMHSDCANCEGDGLTSSEEECELCEGSGEGEAIDFVASVNWDERERDVGA